MQLQHALKKSPRPLMLMAIMAASASVSAQSLPAPDLDGSYIGSYLLQARDTDSGDSKGTGVASYTWEWKFDSATKVGTVTFSNGQIQQGAGGPIFNYRVRTVEPLLGASSGTVLPVTDIGNGYYLVPYRFEVDYVPLGTRRVNSYAKFLISKDVSTGDITIETQDIDGDGIPGINIPASAAAPSPLPANIQQQWNGTAQED